MVRCPACGYAVGKLDGAPRAAGAAFERDVICPECGWKTPAGSRVAVGSGLALAVGSRIEWKKQWPFAVLALIALFVWLPKLVRDIFAWLAGGATLGFDTIVFAAGGAALVVALLGAGRLWRLRAGVRADAGFDEKQEAILFTRGWLFAPGALVSFDRTKPKTEIAWTDARVVRAVRVVERGPTDFVSQSTPCEVFAALLPPGPPLTLPVYLRAEAPAALLSDGFLASLRAPVETDTLAELEAWRSTAGAGDHKFVARRAQSAGAPAPGVEMTDAGTAIVLRGWPATPRPSVASAAVRLGSAQLVPALAGICGAFAVLFVMGGIPTVLGATMFGLNFVFFAAVLAFLGHRARRNASAVAIWRVTPTGVSITQGSSCYEVPRAAIRSIDLATALGVPYLTITAGTSKKPDATIIPDDWGGRTPAEVIEAFRSEAGVPARSEPRRM
jgi:hypothetical protein